jgi:hypothetical protein
LLFSEKSVAREPQIELTYTDTEDFCQLPDDEPDDFWQLASILLSSRCVDVRRNALNALVRVLENFPGEAAGSVGSAVISAFAHFETIEEIMIIMSILAQTAAAVREAYMSDLISSVSVLVESDNIEVVDAVCGFLEAFIVNGSGSFVWRLRIVDRMFVVGCDAPFTLRRSTTRLLLKAAANCSAKKLRRLIEMGIIEYFVEFLETDAAEVRCELLRALLRIVDFLFKCEQDPTRIAVITEHAELLGEIAADGGHRDAARLATMLLTAIGC